MKLLWMLDALLMLRKKMEARRYCQTLDLASVVSGPALSKNDETSVTLNTESLHLVDILQI